MESRDEYLKIALDYLYDGKVPETRKVECRFESALDWLGGLSGYFVTIRPPEIAGGVSSAHYIFCAIDQKKTRMVINDGYSKEEVDIVDFQENGRAPVRSTRIDPDFIVTESIFKL
ncbi:hypothetical protein [Armatimonas rosea]|uniref:hypothetical protein n=1 Tax=Armatimonas rosea TaxID=685828 RepID=UPI00160C6E60|nr:hypothetical protein [Armatimonas rosea]